MSRIRKLSEGTINRIAAGEVIERPASVVKELTENAIDAGASQIDVVFREGGRVLIRVSDNGHGMGADDLALAIERHATSKLADEELVHIKTLGFRGEALPSIGSVSRMTITSRVAGGATAHAISLEGGVLSPVRPAALTRGTGIDVRDLFFAVPARLKFLKSPRAETAEAVDTVKRLAMAHPAVGFSFTSEERRLLDLPVNEEPRARIAHLMGEDFLANAAAFSGEREGSRVEGFASLPTWHRSQSSQQYLFVNGRPVRDKLLAGAIKGAYADLMMRGRFPAMVLFIEAPMAFLDVNVHPAKAEVRFRDGGLVRSLIIGTVRAALGVSARQSAPGLARGAFDYARSSFGERQAGFAASAPQGFAEAQSAFVMDGAASARTAVAMAVDSDAPLGAARAQLHENYIVAQTRDGIVIVDQHAAHERLVYEKLKGQFAARAIAGQPLLVPEVIELDAAAAERLADHADMLAQSGLVLERFGASAIVVREVPAALGGGRIKAMIIDIADDLAKEDASESVTGRINHLLATMACHHSIRSGRILRAEEMNALLREMEATPNSGQCNHGRPTYVELRLEDIEKLFGRR